MGGALKIGKAEMAPNFIAKLYAVEREAPDNSAAIRLDLRQAKSTLILYQFQHWLSQTLQQVQPKTIMGKAVNYTLKYW